MSSRPELYKLQEEIKALIVPLQKKERELRDLVDQEDIEEKKAEFKLIEGSVFMLRTNPFKEFHFVY